MNVQELALTLEAEGFKRSSYSLQGGGTPEDTHSLEDRGYSWAVYYSERGQIFAEEIFLEESDACGFFLDRMRSNPTTKPRHDGGLRRP